MPTNPDLLEWMRLYEAPFTFDKYGIGRDSNGNVAFETQYIALGTFIAEKLNELYSQNKENGK